MKNINTDFVTLPKYRLTQMSVDDFIARVRRLEGRRLKALYLKICGEDNILVLKNNTVMMRRLICDAFQKQKLGGLSTRHYNIIYKLSLDYDGQTPIKTKDKYTPVSGTILTRKWKQQDHIVRVNDNGFDYQGESYNSLSQIAKTITGYERSGPAFFGLNKTGGQTS